MSVPAKLSKACPYAGCQYISKAWSSASNDHNLSSHVSNLHAQRTKVWYGAVQVTIYRDLTTKAFGCPCGAFTNNDASLVRAHARKRHKGSADAQLMTDKSMADPAPTEDAIFLSPPPCQSTSRNLLKAPDTDRSSSTKSKLGTGLDSASLRKYKQTTLAAPRFSAASSFQPTVSLGSKRSREHVDEDASNDARPVKARKMDATIIDTTPIASSHHAETAAPIVSRVQSVLKPRFIHETQPASGWRSYITTTPSNPTMPRLDTASASLAVPSNTTEAQAAGSRQPVHAGKPIQASRCPIMPSPLSKRNTPENPLSDDLVDDSADSEDEVTKVAPRFTDEMECHVCLKRVWCELGDPRTRSIWTCLKCRWAKKTARTTAKVAVSTSTTPAANPFSTATAQEAASSKAKAVESSSNASKRQSLASSTIVSQAPRHVAFASSPDSESSSGPEPSYLHVSDDQPEDSTPAEMTPGTIKRGAVIEPPVRRQRMTKQKRERDFRHWFNAFLEDYNAKKVAGSALPNDGPEPVKSLQKAGKTAYTTADEFFAAFTTHFCTHQQNLEDGKKTVMAKFYGGYSIVAQPRIGHQTRAEKVVERLRGIGLRIDGSDPSVEHVNDAVLDSLKTTVHWHTWLYPCNCGGTVNPKPLPALNSLHNNPHPLTPCFGKILLEVVDDHTLHEYGIKGQHIALRIVH